MINFFKDDEKITTKIIIFYAIFILGALASKKFPIVIISMVMSIQLIFGAKSGLTASFYDILIPAYIKLAIIQFVYWYLAIPLILLYTTKLKIKSFKHIFINNAGLPIWTMYIASDISNISANFTRKAFKIKASQF